MWEITRYALAIFIGAVLLGFAIRIGIQIAHGGERDRMLSPPDIWFTLVIELQKQEHCLYGPDRAFLREMINALATDTNAMPDAAQRRWILSLKKECKL